mmetsp:Transcript_21/g.70  ORF Transcript_21/g.70 Transcript_21/m.70 type:complete len:995 (-) Transcript_21:73-3057(-)
MAAMAAEAEGAAVGASAVVGELYTSAECNWLVFYWLCAWLVGHHLFWFLWQCGRAPLFPESTLQRYRCRLMRSQVYCAISTVASAYLLAQCGWNAFDLLHKFSPDHQLFFTMAVAHWMISIWEDMQCISLLGAGLDSEAVLVDANIFLAQAYLTHHIVAGFGFYMINRLQGCTGIGAFGLLYELPVLMMNHREFAVLCDPRPAWMLEKAKMEEFWYRYKFAYVIGRIIPTIVYVYSLLSWRDDLALISWGEVLLYHFMAIFFTYLNYQLLNVLNGWYASDNRVNNKHLEAQYEARVVSEGGTLNGENSRGKDQEMGVDDDAGDNIVNEPEPVCDEVGPVTQANQLKEVTEEEFYRDSGATYEPGVVWIEIDGIAYDVSGFMDLHPGGAATLQRFLGRDATEAFHRVRHSLSAKLMMQKFAVGAILKKDAKYRIFEQRQTFDVIDLMKPMVLGAIGVGLFYPYSIYADFLTALPPDAAWASFLAPGLCLCGVLGALSVGPQFVQSPFSFFWNITWHSSVIGVCWPLLSCGFLLIKRPRPAGLPWFTPSGAEFVVLGLFLAEELRELAVETKYWSWHILIGLVFALFGLYMRGAAEVVARAPEQTAGAALLTVSIFLLCHHTRSSGKAKEAKKVDTAVGVFLGAFFSALGLVALNWQGPAAKEAVVSLWRYSWSSFLLSIPGMLACLIVASEMFSKCYAFSPSWALRSMANMFGIFNGLSGGLSSYYWCMWVAWYANNASVSIRHRKHHDELIASGNFHMVPSHFVGTRGLWDTFRAANCAAIWSLVHAPMRFLVNQILPEELRVHSFSLPIFDLGEVANYGVAAYTAPTHSQFYRESPEHYEVSIRHLDTSTQAGLRDLRRGANVVQDLWKDKKGESVKGLVAHLMCIIPNVGGTQLDKEIRLACWQTAEDAANFRARQRSTAAVAAAERRGGWKGLAEPHAGTDAEITMRPMSEIRHQDRCRDCFRLLESMQMGQKAPKKCSTCGGKGREYPFF